MAFSLIGLLLGLNVRLVRCSAHTEDAGQEARLTVGLHFPSLCVESNYMTCFMASEMRIGVMGVGGTPGRSF